MLGKVDLHGKGSSAEDNMRWNVVFPMSKDVYNQNMYRDAAKRVVFKNCMAACEIEDERIPNFNKNFYFNQIEEQTCLQDCFNTRMDLHFGKTNARNHNLHIDFAE